MNYKKILLLLCLVLLESCASYTTPGGAVSLSELADGDINELMAKEPAAIFPVNLAIARVQASGYSAYGVDSYGSGRYSVVTARDVVSEDDFERIKKLPGIRGLAPLNRLILSPNLDSIKALRLASARLKSDILLIYTFDTTFHIGEQKLAPLNVVALGMLKNKEVMVTTTASAAFFDVRTEYLFGLAEATARERKKSSIWQERAAVDDLRVVTEKAAFAKLLSEVETTWKGVVAQFGTR